MTQVDASYLASHESGGEIPYMIHCTDPTYSQGEWTIEPDHVEIIGPNGEIPEPPLWNMIYEYALDELYEKLYAGSRSSRAFHLGCDDE